MIIRSIVRWWVIYVIVLHVSSDTSTYMVRIGFDFWNQVWHSTSFNRPFTTSSVSNISDPSSPWLPTRSASKPTNGLEEMSRSPRHDPQSFDTACHGRPGQDTSPRREQSSIDGNVTSSERRNSGMFVFRFLFSFSIIILCLLGSLSYL
jgi:hypothetical protein